MEKGISPVVAVVLLIAIAVIAAVGVWYWVGEFTTQPNTPTDVKTFGISQCGSNGTAVNVFIRNTGKDALDTNVEFYSATDNTLAGVIGFETVSVAVDAAAMVPILENTSAISGNYKVLASGVQTMSFSC